MENNDYSYSIMSTVDSDVMHREGVGGGGVIRISTDGPDQKIWGGLKFSLQGFFWVGKFGKYFVAGLF